MTTLQISKQKALALYPTASNEFKAMLEETFGKEFFSVKITDRIKTYEDACEILGEEPINEHGFRCHGFSDDEIALRKLKTITRALNEGWDADWSDSNQKKWIPYFTVSSGVFVFDVTYYLYSAADAGYASRLCFKSDDLATYAGQQFTKLYQGFIL